MNNNIEKIEQLIGQMNGLENVTGAVMSSVAWSYAVSLVSMSASLRMFEPVTENDRDRVKNLEKRIDAARDVLAWASSYASPDFAPTGERVVDLILNNERTVTTDAALIKEIAAAFEITEAQAQAAANLNAKQMAERALVQKRAIENDRESYIRLVDMAMAAHVHMDFELEDMDAIRILEKIAYKCEQYETNRVARAMTTRRQRRITQLAAERKLLADIMNQADELADRLQTEIDNATAASPVEQALTDLVA